MALNIAGFNLNLEAPRLSTQGFGFWVTIFAIVFVILIIIAIIIYLVFQQRLYNKKIIVFENISGQGFQVAGRDRARIIKVGDGGEEVLYLRKRKVYRTAYGRKMGKNTYWFAIGQDGYWYNIVLGDLDAKMGMLDIEPIDRDMRYMHVAIRKNIQERYRKESFMQKYGMMVMSSIFLLIMLVAIWLLMSKAGDLIEAAKPVAEALTSASDKLVTAVGRLDAIYSGGSGVTPAG